jgi:hypothetical protein
MACTVVLVMHRMKTEVKFRHCFQTRKVLGFYGSFSMGYSQINSKDALVSGGRAGMIFNHSTAVGIAGYGFVNNMEAIVGTTIMC